MRNKIANCYNIELNFKYSIVKSTFSEDTSIYRTLLFVIWHLRCQQRQTKNDGSDFIEFICLFIICRIIKFILLILLKEAILDSKAVLNDRNSTAFLLNTSKTCFYVELLPIFSHTFFGTNFRDQNTNNVIETTNCFTD